MADKKPTKPKAVIYRQLCINSTPPKGQLADLKAYASAQGWDVIQVITDRHDPDTKSPKERDGLVEMLWRARLKKFDVLLVWSLDDLSRVGIKHTLNHLQTLRNNSIEWHCFTDPLLSSEGEHSEIVLAVLSKLTACANLRRSARIAKEYEAGKKQGKKGRTPAGRINAPTLKKAKIAQKLRKSGMKFRAIAEVLEVTHPRVHQLCQYDIEGEEGRVPAGRINDPTLKKARTAQKLRKSGMKLREIAKVLGVTPPRVYQLCQLNIEGEEGRGRE